MPLKIGWWLLAAAVVLGFFAMPAAEWLRALPVLAGITLFATGAFIVVVSILVQRRSW